MSKPMTKSNIADHIAQRAEVVNEVTFRILDELTDLVYKGAKNSLYLKSLRMLF